MAGQQGIIFLNEEDPEVFKHFVHWAYNGIHSISIAGLNFDYNSMYKWLTTLSHIGTVKQPRTKIYVKSTISQAESDHLESELLVEFNGTLQTLVSLYSLGERWGIHNLMNRAIDAIQDGYLGFGTVFGPGLAAQIWRETKSDSTLREFCIATTVMHLGEHNYLSRYRSSPLTSRFPATCRRFTYFNLINFHSYCKHFTIF